MGWTEKIQTPFTITCGDGKTYTPNWTNASKGVEYNVAIFEFINVRGSLVRRKLPKGTRYAITIIFQGDDHLDVAGAFEESAANPAAWTIQHPFYGTLLVQPSDLTFDNEGLNVSKITGLVTETITETAATISVISPADKINSDKAKTDALLAQTAANDVPNIETTETRSLLSSTTQIYNKVSKQIKSSADAANFFNAYNKANAYINSGFYDTIDTLGAIHDYVSLPYQFADTLTKRLNMFVDQYNLLTANLSGLLTQQSKKLYEHNAGLTITGLVQSSITNIENAYNNIDDVFGVIDIILNTYNQYIQVLDSIQSDNGGDPDSYIPDADAITALSQLVSFALGSLIDISANSKQKRTIYLQEHSNIISVANDIYGLLPDDSTLDTLINTNNIGLSEILQLQKGRKITYYQ